MPSTVPYFGTHQIGFEGASDEEVERRAAEMLYRSINLGRTIAFVGSGVSRARGYPSWEEFAAGVIAFTRERGPKLDEGTRKLLDAWSAEAGSHGGAARSDHLPLALGLCEEAFTKARARGDLRKAMADLVVPRTQPDAEDPLETILRVLPIRRFITTNYDLEIESSLVRVLGCPATGLRVGEHGEPLNAEQRGRKLGSADTGGPIACSLELDPQNTEALFRFAVGAPEDEVGVLHCHGIKTNPETMIVTERDYQRIYLHDDPTNRAFRDSLHLAFSANPILFIGVGMEEADLLRPLREFVSESDRDPRERPLFALLEAPKTSSGEEDPLLGAEKRRHLYVRYGVKVIYFHRTAAHRSQSHALCDEIRRIGEAYSDWWRAWQRKPALRSPRFGRIASGAVIRHYISTSSPRLEEPENRRSIFEALEHGTGAVLVLGRVGSGKGNLGNDLVLDPTHSGVYDRRFFATAHFSNDFLSIIDGAVEFLGGGGDTGDSLDRFQEALRSGKHLVVIGGVERLLEPGLPSGADQPLGSSAGDLSFPLGRPINREAERLFEIAATVANESRSHLVLTSAVEPSGLDRKIEIRRIQGLPRRSIASALFPSLRDPSLLEELRETLRGHLYAFAVTGRVLAGMELEERDLYVKRLIALLSNFDFGRRPALAVQSALERIALGDRLHGRHGLVDVLHRFAMFTTPVSLEAMAETYPPGDPGRERMKRATERLHEASLLLRVEPPDPQDPVRFTAHTLVRTHSRVSLGGLSDAAGEPQRFGLTAFAGKTEPHQPLSTPGHVLASESLDRLLDSLEAQRSEGRLPQREPIRAAFALIRSRWTAATLPRSTEPQEESPGGLRVPHYDAYLKRLMRLADVLRGASLDVRRETTGAPADLWLNRLSPEAEITRPHAPLYSDELAWLYNEMGLGLWCQGMMFDAYAVFRLGEDINRQVDHGAQGARWCHSHLNLAMVSIERARLGKAGYHLTSALRAARERNDRDLEGQALGYMGLVEHLSGNYARSRGLYEQAIERLRSTRNARGTSIFLRHQGDLLRLSGHQKEARESIHESLVIAEAANHPDLIHYSRIAEANVRLREQDLTAQEVLLPAVEFARRMGVPKLEADAYKVQAHIALAHGETELASRLALSCMSIATALGMRLRLTASLVVLGRVALRRGDARTAEGMLQAAISLGTRQGYQLQVEDAARELMQIGAWSDEMVRKLGRWGAGSKRSGEERSMAS